MEDGREQLGACRYGSEAPSDVRVQATVIQILESHGFSGTPYDRLIKSTRAALLTDPHQVDSHRGRTYSPAIPRVT
jgi:hypothetical protein